MDTLKSVGVKEKCNTSKILIKQIIRFNNRADKVSRLSKRKHGQCCQRVGHAKNIDCSHTNGRVRARALDLVFTLSSPSNASLNIWKLRCEFFFLRKSSSVLLLSLKSALNQANAVRGKPFHDHCPNFPYRGLFETTSDIWGGRTALGSSTSFIESSAAHQSCQ